LGDLVRLPSTRKITKKVMKEVLKDNQENTAQKRNLKNKVVVEEEVQPENVLDHKGGEIEKDIDDDIAIGVMLIREKALSQSFTDGGVQNIGTRSAKKVFKKSILTGTKIKQRETLAEEELEVASKSSKLKRTMTCEGSVTEGPDTTSSFAKQRELLSVSLEKRGKPFRRHKRFLEDEFLTL
ncbi:hypothetical protein HAX54_009840, partial [Datura stramonium]|nr:hypothetical protein [Datura stramonium]